MPLKEELENAVQQNFQNQWKVREGRIVPEATDLILGSDAVHFDNATLLYADLADSTTLVKNYDWYFAAEIYKNFLFFAARIINDEGGKVRSYDGDRVMGVFIGKASNTIATRCALKINYAVIHIIKPRLIKQYPSADYDIKHVVGVDFGEVRTARAGVRNDNDLIWIGNSANIAAKISSSNEGYSSVVTPQVYETMNDSSKFFEGKNMWNSFYDREICRQLYGSSWYWPI